MTYAENLWLFSVLLFGIIIVPGMDMLFVLTNALTGGRPTGLSATAGMMAGGAVHTLTGAFGVGLLLSLAPSLVSVLVLAGSAYMAWIGISLLQSSIIVASIGSVPVRSKWVAMRQGFVTCILNPKAYMFILAVYPQFIKPQYGAVWSQALVMGVLTMLTQLGIYGGLAMVAGQSREFLVSRPHVTMAIGRAAGVVFLVVAALTAWHGWTSA